MSVCVCTSRYSARAFTPLCHNPACTHHSVDYTDKKQGRTQSGKYCSKCSARYCSQQCHQTDRFRHEMRQCDIRESLIELSDVCGGETPKNKSLIMTKVIGALQNSCPCNPARFFNLSMCLEHGVGCQPDEHKSHEMLKILAKDRHVRALETLAKHHLHGVGTGINKDLHFECSMQAANLNSAIGLLFVGMAKITGTGTEIDHEEAFSYIRGAARQNFLPAMYQVAQMVKNGVGTKKNEQTAHALFHAAASKGCLHSAHVLGHSYAFGDGCVRDEQEAFKHFREAAKGLRDKCVYYHLHMMYNNGRGVKTNKKKAIKYLELAKKEERKHCDYPLPSFLSS